MRANTISLNSSNPIALGGLILSALAPTLQTVNDAFVSIPTAELNISGIDCNFLQKNSIPVVSLVASGIAPTADSLEHNTQAPGLGGLTLNAIAPTIAQKLLMDVGDMSINSPIPVVVSTPETILPISVGQLDLSGPIAGVNLKMSPPAVGDITANGIDALMINALSVSLGMAQLTPFTPAFLQKLSLIEGIAAASFQPLTFKQSVNMSLGDGLATGQAFNMLTKLSIPVGQLNLNPPLVNLLVPGAASPSDLAFVKFAQTGGGTKDMLVFRGANYNPLKSYPIIIFYHGDGAKGVVTAVTNQSLGTGNGSQVTFTGNFTNPSTSDVSCLEIIFKVNGVEKGRGTRTASVAGAGVSGGSVAYQATGGAISVTFTSAPAVGATVTVDYKYSDLLADAGTPVYLNTGDEPTDVLIFCPQINVVSFDAVKDYDDVVTYAAANFNVDLNRIYVTGLSRGGFQVRLLLQTRFADNNPTGTFAIAAYVNVSCGYNSGYTWSNYADIGGWWHHGTADGNQVYPLATVLNNQIGFVNIPHETTGYWNKGHEAFVWNTSVYDRKNRTDATGSAIFDYIDFLKMFSKDLTQRATLHTEAAESSLDICIYRRALVQVNRMTAGSDKTALLARLAAVKTSIGTVYTIDWGISTNASGGNINDLTSGAANAALTNIIDDAGGSSSIGIKIVRQSTTAGTKVQSQSRCNLPFHGLGANFNIDAGIALPAVTDGEIEFNNLPAGTYKVIVYCFSGNSTATDAQVGITIGGVTKTIQSEHNSYHNIIFSGLSRDGANKIVMDITAPGGSQGRIAGFDLIKA